MKSLRIKWIVSLLALVLLLPSAGFAHTPSTGGAGAELRSSLGQMFGDHALLAAFAMQKGIDGKADFKQSAAALNANTDEITAAIASVYGKEAGTAFKPIWASHIGYFVDYVKATGAKDEAARQKALSDLEVYRMKQAEFFASANPNLPKEAVAASLKIHIDHLLVAFDSYAVKDFDKAYEQIHTAYVHMFETGDTITGAIAAQFPDKFAPASVKNPASDVRSLLERVLGEHATLAVIAMQKGIDSAADFNQAAGSLNANTDELTHAVTSVYGDEAGQAFKTIWSSHIGYFVDYVKATAAKDETARQKALSDLETYRMKQAKFFEDANPEYFKKDAIAEGLKTHIHHLLAAFDSYAAKDYDNAHKNAREAYSHMIPTGTMLASGIVAQFPDKFHGEDQGSMAPVVKFQIGSQTLMLDQKAVMMDVAPFIKQEWSFIPLRYLAEGIGAEVTWDAATQTAWVKAGKDTATFWVGKNYMELNGKKMEIGIPIFLEGGRMQVPVRFIAELFGWDVKWENTARTIELTKKEAAHTQH
ncbi:copper amine oxidase N-terminal domain-containing protein [Paenibacillus sp. FJAT-26967]|uniref:copper amine oxidase N-terminal domain-containing protein n=1 Tax=Paenibacillus sp. FJAT-26967 TaxID=1729690 RepID=UPI00083825FE|nr:copper amine oxidase N-terminal domain-containing protein [Paenibacillus sp. FJAT-26967]